MERNRKIYFLLIVLTIIIGLLSRSDMIPEFIYPFLGDYLYAIMYFFIAGFVFSEMESWKIALVSIFICYAIELAQFYQADWIENIRSYKLGGLILGHSFLWSDMICYTLGRMTGYYWEVYFCRKNKLDNFMKHAESF